MSQNKIVSGKKPLSARENYKESTLTEDIFGNTLALPEGLKKELAEQGLVGRWVNAKTLYANQGYHPKNWVPYKKKSSDTIDTKDFLQGNDPSGIVRRGDCILAVKKHEDVAKHRSYLRQKADRYTRFNKEKAEELKNLARENRVNTIIDEGYNEED